MADRGPPDIEERTLDYSLRAVRLFRALRDSRDGAADVISRQFLRSATSVGANIAEARSAESKADFIHKHALALKEARESLYWLRLTKRAGIMPPDLLEPLIAETDELIAIITTIMVNRRRRKD